MIPAPWGILAGDWIRFGRRRRDNRCFGRCRRPVHEKAVWLRTRCDARLWGMRPSFGQPRSNFCLTMSVGPLWVAWSPCSGRISACAFSQGPVRVQAVMTGVRPPTARG